MEEAGGGHSTFPQEETKCQATAKLQNAINKIIIKTKPGHQNPTKSTRTNSKPSKNKPPQSHTSHQKAKSHTSQTRPKSQKPAKPTPQKLETPKATEASGRKNNKTNKIQTNQLLSGPSRLLSFHRRGPTPLVPPLEIPHRPLETWTIAWDSQTREPTAGFGTGRPTDVSGPFGCKHGFKAMKT